MYSSETSFNVNDSLLFNSQGMKSLKTPFQNQCFLGKMEATPSGNNPSPYLFIEKALLPLGHKLNWQ